MGNYQQKVETKRDFINRLQDNIKRYSFHDISPLNIRSERDRMFIDIENEEKFDILMERLPNVLVFNHSALSLLVKKI